MLTVIGQSLSSGHAQLGLPCSSTLHFLGSLHFTSAQGSETAWIKVSLRTVPPNTDVFLQKL